MLRGLDKDEARCDIELMVTGNPCPPKKGLVDKREETRLIEYKIKVLQFKKDHNEVDEELSQHSPPLYKLFITVLNSAGPISDL